MASFTDRVQWLACRLDDWLDRGPYLFWAPFSAGFWLPAYFICRSKPLWYDELLSLHAASLPDLGSIWEVTRSGAVAEPPLFAVLARLALEVIPDPHLGLRLPAALGIWVLCLCVFRFTRRIAGALAAAVAVMAILSTEVASYIPEGRPYGLLMGCLGVALASWQEAAGGKHRRLGLFGLAVSLFCAIQTHYYGVLLLFPFVLGELIRTVSCKRADTAVWSALAVAGSSVLLLLPLVGAASDYARNPWNPASWASFLRFQSEMFEKLVPPVLLILGLLAVLRLGRNGLPEAEGRGVDVSKHELGVIVGLCAFPVLVLSTSFLVTNSLSLRYFLPAAVGFALFAAVLLPAARRSRSLVGAVALVSLSACYGFNTWETSNVVADRRAGIPHPDALRPYDGEQRLPIVVASYLRFLQLAHYWPPELRTRMYYLTGPKAALRFERSATGELAVTRLAPWLPLNIRPYDAFVSRHQEFLLLQTGRWWKDRLLSDGARLDLQGTLSDYRVYVVRLADSDGDPLEADLLDGP